MDVPIVTSARQVDIGELSDAAFFPVYERAEALGLPVFLHPVNVIDPERLLERLGEPPGA